MTVRGFTYDSVCSRECTGSSNGMRRGNRHAVNIGMALVACRFRLLYSRCHPYDLTLFWASSVEQLLLTTRLSVYYL
jgi:hypothetical protein